MSTRTHPGLITHHFKAVKPTTPPQSTTTAFTTNATTLRQQTLTQHLTHISTQYSYYISMTFCDSYAMMSELTTLTSLSIHITSTAVGISYPSRYNTLTQPTHTYDHLHIDKPSVLNRTTSTLQPVISPHLQPLFFFFRLRHLKMTQLHRP